MEVWKTQACYDWFGELRGVRQRVGGGVTHHDRQPVIVEVGALKVFTQPWDSTSKKKEGQDPCGRGLEVSVTPLRSPLQLPSTPAFFLVTPALVLTDTSHYQQFSEEQQQVCDFVQDNHPAWGVGVGWG